MADLLSKRRSRSWHAPRSPWRSPRSSPATVCRNRRCVRGRDHTTVLHACKRIKELRDSEQRIKEDYNC